MRLSLLVSSLIVSTACQGKAPDPAPAKALEKKAPEVAKAESEPKTTANEPEAPPAPIVADADPKPPGDAADPLGKRFVDPPWFRKELFPGATSAKVNRTQRNEQGLFSSQILFDLPAGTTEADCAKTLKEEVGKHVPDLKEAPDAKQPGRLQITGSTDRYKVLMMCGDAKGTMRAYVSFEWTTP
jgi:hypothetical protein